MATIETRPDIATGIATADVATIAAIIARSPIVVAPIAAARRHLPDGYEDVDVAVLDWIAAEARLIGRALFRI
jgi:hypothetical protein